MLQVGAIPTSASPFASPLQGPQKAAQTTAGPAVNARDTPRTDQTNIAPAKEKQASANAAENRSSEKEAPGQLTDAEQQVVNKLKARDREVRAHEQAHKAVGGQYAGAISYEYQTGPDNKRYAVGGSVPIDTSPEKTPEATISKMQVVIAAALAPAEPSSADRSIAQQAKATMAEAQAELRSQKTAERNGDAGSPETSAKQQQAAELYQLVSAISAPEAGRSITV